VTNIRNHPMAALAVLVLGAGARFSTAAQESRGGG